MKLLNAFPCEGYGGQIAAWVAQVEADDGRVLVLSTGKQEIEPTEAEWLEMAREQLEREAQLRAPILEVEAEDGTII